MKRQGARRARALQIGHVCCACRPENVWARVNENDTRMGDESLNDLLFMCKLKACDCSQRRAVLYDLSEPQKLNFGQSASVKSDPLSARFEKKNVKRTLCAN